MWFVKQIFTKREESGYVNAKLTTELRWRDDAARNDDPGILVTKKSGATSTRALQALADQYNSEGKEPPKPMAICAADRAIKKNKDTTPSLFE